jgi:hypothetical protein
MKFLIIDSDTKIFPLDAELTIVKKGFLSKLIIFIRFVELMAMITY